MNSQGLRQIAQGLHGSASFRALELKLEVDTCPIPKGEAISKGVSPWKPTPLLRGGCMSRSRWPAETDLSGFFGGSLSHNVSGLVPHPSPFKILSFKNFLLIHVFSCLFLLYRFFVYILQLPF